MNSKAFAKIPQYRSHKVVGALKIKEVAGNADFSATLYFEDDNYAPIDVDKEYVGKHRPQAGGYYVRYADNYESWSPAKAFEEGYELIKE